MGRPRQHDAATKAALIAAAERLLERNQPLSARALAEATRSTTRAVYSVFGNMDGVYLTLLARAFTAISERVEATPTTKDPAADLVEAGVSGFRVFAITQPSLFRVAFERVVETPDDPALAEVMQRSLRALGDRVKRCDQLGGRATRTVVWQFHAFTQGLASVELQGWLPRGEDPEAIWRDALTAFVGGLATKPKRRR